MIQALPFIAAVVLATLERTPLNDFATWRALEGKLAEVLGREAPAAVAKAPAPATAEKQAELVQ